MQVRLLLGMSSVAIEMLLKMCHAHVTASCLPSQVVLQGDQHDKEIGSPKGAQEEDQVFLVASHMHGHLQHSLILYRLSL